jgi:large subunit ribosomal protein L28e
LHSEDEETERKGYNAMQVATNGYRPDLKAAALARLSAVHKSLRVAKRGSTKKVSKSRKSGSK